MNQPGKVVRIGEVEQVSTSFKKRILIIEVPGQYPQILQFEAVQDKVSIFDNLIPGENVNVHFNLNGREHNGKVYNQLQAWKVE
jgi:single-strand DNA-binding protein